MAQKYIDEFERILSEPGTVNDCLTKAEILSGVKRIYLVPGLGGLVSLYLIYGYGAALLCNCIGFFYPAYASIKAIESANKDDDTKWLTYWVVFACFSTIEYFSDFVLSWFPLYWLAKCILLLWCSAPYSWNGSTLIYQKYIRPVFYDYQTELDGVAGAAQRLASQGAEHAQRIAAEALTKRN